ncbi:MAG: hypothetical protein V8Q40_06205 [Anaerosacchariphilus sp.]
MTVAEVLEILEGSYRIADEDVSPESRCYAVSETMQERLIDPINQAMERFLSELTLEELKADYQQRLSSGQDMYYI